MYVLILNQCSENTTLVPLKTDDIQKSYKETFLLIIIWEHPSKQFNIFNYFFMSIYSLFITQSNIKYLSNVSFTIAMYILIV